MNRHGNNTSKRDNLKYLEFSIVTSAIAMAEKGLLKNRKLAQIKHANSPFAKSLYRRSEQCYLACSVKELAFTFADISEC